MKNLVTRTTDIHLSSPQLDCIADAVGRVADAMESGISVRDEVAVRIITGLVSREDHTGMDPAFIVSYAYQVADRVLKKKVEEA